MITINHYKFIDEYSIIRNISYHKYLPSYLGKYRNSLIFINGESVNYRLITVYTLIDKKLSKICMRWNCVLIEKIMRRSIYFFIVDVQ